MRGAKKANVFQNKDYSYVIIENLTQRTFHILQFTEESGSIITLFFSL